MKKKIISSLIERIIILIIIISVFITSNDVCSEEIYFKFLYSFVLEREREREWMVVLVSVS